MNVAICYSKKSPRGDHILECFEKGVNRCGDSTHRVKQVSDLEYLRKCDVAVMYGWYNPNLGVGSKKAIRARTSYIMQSMKRRVIVIDTAFIGSDNYLSIGFDGIKNYADFNIKGPMPDDRWQLISKEENLVLKPCRPYNENGHILIIGQNRFGVSTYDIDVWKWHIETAEQLLKITSNREIRFRIHPRGRFAQALKDFPDDKRITFSQDNKPFSEDLKNCFCVVTYTSNAVCEALLNGIPAITLCVGSPAWDITGHSISAIEDVILKPREEWLHTLCYKQWSIPEIKKGLPWQFLKSGVKLS